MEDVCSQGRGQLVERRRAWGKKKMEEKKEEDETWEGRNGKEMEREEEKRKVA